MTNIMLFCAGGMSTGMLVKRMQAAAEAEGEDCEISAHGLPELDAYADQADVILLAPQVSYNLNDVKQRYPGKPIAAIGMKEYGMMQGDEVLDEALDLVY